MDKKTITEKLARWAIGNDERIRYAEYLVTFIAGSDEGMRDSLLVVFDFVLETGEPLDPLEEGIVIKWFRDSAARRG